MGTNFYLRAPQKPPCECCGREFESSTKHIGKSSAGWCFSLHVMPEQGINSLADWERLWGAAGAWIEDEYGDVLTPEQMRRRITDRGGNGGPPSRQDFDYERNHAVPGPNGLVRHRLGERCIGHGDGPWDCILGEFS